jgi:acylphosphatase
VSEARRFLVSGRVQGVGFRAFARRAASRLGVVGYARNLADGRVEVLAIGADPALAELEAVLRRGPSLGRVDQVSGEEAVATSDYKSFEIN